MTAAVTDYRQSMTFQMTTGVLKNDDAAHHQRWRRHVTKCPRVEGDPQRIAQPPTKTDDDQDQHAVLMLTDVLTNAVQHD